MKERKNSKGEVQDILVAEIYGIWVAQHSNRGGELLEIKSVGSPPN